MFEDLNAVPWIDLHQAYGSAEEVPVWLRRLISPRRSIRKQALRSLYGSICHQGSVYSATTPAVPYLLEVLDMAAPHDTIGILDLLADIASAHSWWDNNLSDDSPFFVQERTTPEFQQHMVDDRASASRARAAVRAGLAQFMKLLSSNQPSIQMRAAHILAGFREQPSEMRAVLREVYAHAIDPVVQAFLLYLLRTLQTEGDNSIPFFTAIFEQTQVAIVRVVAALALVEWQRDDAHDDVLRCIVEAVCVPTEHLMSQWSQFPRTGHLLFVIRWLYAVTPTRLQFSVPLLIARMDQLTVYQSYAFAKLLLTIAFSPHTTTVDPSLVPDGIPVSALQRTVLMALLESKLSWDHEWQSLLKQLGLPHDRQSLAALIEFSPPPDPPLPSPPLHTQHQPTSSQGFLVFATAQPPTVHPRDRMLHSMDVFHDAFPELEYSPFGGSGGAEHDATTRPYQQVVAGRKKKTILQFPLTQAGLESARYQVEVLRVLKARLPIAIPDPVYTRLDTNVLGDAFWGYTPVAGKPLDVDMLMSVPNDTIRLKLIDKIGYFLSVLHDVPATDFPVPLRIRPTAIGLADLVPQMPSTEHTKRAIIDYLRTYMATPANFSFKPSVVHGTFGSDSIVYDAQSQDLSGIIQWDAVGLGDPAVDFGALASSYDAEFIERVGRVTPMSPALMARIPFFAGLFILQRMMTLSNYITDQAASGQNDEDALHRREMWYEDLAYEEAQLASWWRYS